MIWKQFLLILILAVVSLFIFNYAKSYIFSRFTIKRRYIFIFLILLFILPLLLPKIYTIAAVQYAHFILITLGVLVYMEVVKIDRDKKNRPVVGRPKPKANRMKNK